MGVWRNPVADTWELSRRSSYIVLSLALLALLFCFVWRDDIFRETLRYTLQGIALFPIFWLAIRHPNWLMFRWLNWHPIRFFGVISYTFYLSHLFFLKLAGQLFSADILLRTIFGFILTLSFSVLMFYVVERPIADLRKRLHNNS